MPTLKQGGMSRKIAGKSLCKAKKWVLPVFGKKIKFHSLPWLRGASRSGRSSPPYFGNALPARAFTA
jgi:hypothetical protein